MTAPACDPTTLSNDPCEGGCGRRYHPQHRTQRGNTGPCVNGHPRLGGLNRCPGCYTRHRRAAAVTPKPPRSGGLTWQQNAACTGAWPEQFFPDIRAGQNAAKLLAPVAERYCAACPVRAACDRYAEDTHSVGLWAGVLRRYRGSRYTRTPILAAA